MISASCMTAGEGKLKCIKGSNSFFENMTETSTHCLLFFVYCLSLLVIVLFLRMQYNHELTWIVHPNLIHVIWCFLAVLFDYHKIFSKLSFASVIMKYHYPHSV